MSVKITRIDLAKLWNSEYTIFVNQLIDIITRYQPAILYLEKAFNRLVALVPELAKIKAKELSNAISKILSHLDKERRVLFKAIVAEVKVLTKVDLPSITPHVAVLRRFIDIHGDDIADAPYNSETKRLDDLKADYLAKADVKAAAEALNLAVLFDQLFLVNANFATQFMQRTEIQSAAEKVNTRATRKKVDKLLVEFFKSFEHCSREYEELDYATPANKMNKLTSYYKTQLKARATRRKSGKDVSNEPPITAPE